LIGLIGGILSKIKTAKFIFVSQDVYPDVLVASNQVNFTPVRYLLKWIMKCIYGFADQIVVIGEDMKKLLAQKGVPIFKIQTIRNWQDTNKIHPDSTGSFRKEMGIPDSTFLILHSGNIGYSQDFKTLFVAAKKLQNQRDIQFLLIGDGARLKNLRKIAPPNIRFLPYQPEDKLSSSLSSADLHYVSLIPSFLGCIVPSKIYGILAAGKPMILVAPEESDVTQIAKESLSGVFCKPDGEEVVSTIQELKNNRERLTQMGKFGLDWMLKNGTREQATSKYKTLLQELK
jgi:glycosyltransferase involved in cell wall biosynthesis